ncbi:MAG: hypothetical protein AAGA90_14840 [Actinomycetota bacterium]
MGPRTASDPRRCHGDAGASLVELIVAMALTATALAAIVSLISSSSGAAEDIAGDDPLAALAVDWLANDLREATGLDVVATGAGDEVTRLDITTPAGTVRWGTSGGTIERTPPGGSGAQPVAGALRTTDALVIVLRTATDGAIDPDDPVEVDDCTRFVHIQVVDPDDVVLHERTVSLRYPRWEAAPC